jgi:cell division topological specificity factor
MSLFKMFRASRPRTADVAKERLQILLAHERSDRSGPEYLHILQNEILQVIAKFVNIDHSKIEVKLERGSEISTLEVNIELPANSVSSEVVSHSLSTTMSCGLVTEKAP